MENVEDLYMNYETIKKDRLAMQHDEKAAKDKLLEHMKDQGRDEMIINGLEGLMVMKIEYPEETVLDKKELCKELGIKQKEFSKPGTIIELTQSGDLTGELIEKHTRTETPERFSISKHKEEEDEE